MFGALPAPRSPDVERRLEALEKKFDQLLEELRERKKGDRDEERHER
ncbi:MAG: hypothetical protein IRY99_28025 [Isosphaeraceae bacterium]|nr:hypothetical protein [Isosphaeraceae bacterium]